MVVTWLKPLTGHSCQVRQWLGGTIVGKVLISVCAVFRAHIVKKPLIHLPGLLLRERHHPFYDTRASLPIRVQEKVGRLSHSHIVGLSLYKTPYKTGRREVKHAVIEDHIYVLAIHTAAHSHPLMAV